MRVLILQKGLYIFINAAVGAAIITAFVIIGVGCKGSGEWAPHVVKKKPSDAAALVTVEPAEAAIASDYEIRVYATGYSMAAGIVYPPPDNVMWFDGPTYTAYLQDTIPVTEFGGMIIDYTDFFDVTESVGLYRTLDGLPVDLSELRSGESITLETKDVAKNRDLPVRVVDENGSPVSGAQVYVSQSDFGGTLNEWVMSTWSMTQGNMAKYPDYALTLTGIAAEWYRWRMFTTDEYGLATVPKSLPCETFLIAIAPGVTSEATTFIAAVDFPAEMLDGNGSLLPVEIKTRPLELCDVRFFLEYDNGTPVDVDALAKTYGAAPGFSIRLWNDRNEREYYGGYDAFYPHQPGGTLAVENYPARRRDDIAGIWDKGRGDGWANGIISGAGELVKLQGPKIPELLGLTAEERVFGTDDWTVEIECGSPGTAAVQTDGKVTKECTIPAGTYSVSAYGSINSNSDGDPPYYFAPLRLQGTITLAPGSADVHLRMVVD